MSDETTTEQLAEIEGQATEYTPPQRWRVLQVGEVLQPGDVWVNHEGESRPTKRVGETVNDERYIRPIEPEPQPIQVREGRWRTRHGAIRNVTPTPAHDSRAERWPWRDAKYDQTWREDGGCHIIGESPSDLVEYLGPIEQQPEPVPQPNAATIDELRSEVSYVQRLLGESRQRSNELETLVADLQTANAAAEAAKAAAGAALLERQRRNEALVTQGSRQRKRLTQLEELVASLRTINEAQEKAVEAAGKENTALRNQLTAVKAELASVAADRQRLRIELDAAQQVPADSPELRQLRADLAEVIQERDTYRHAHELLLNDVNATHQRTKVMTIEAIVEWLVPIRTCGSQALATAVISNLPHIMRHLTGLEDEGIE